MDLRSSALEFGAMAGGYPGRRPTPGPVTGRRVAHWYALAPSAVHRPGCTDPPGTRADDRSRIEPPDAADARRRDRQTGSRPEPDDQPVDHAAGGDASTWTSGGPARWWSAVCLVGPGRHRGRPAHRRRPEQQPDRQPAPHGVPVDVTVTGCLGLMGGTGAQAAGYSCTGTYTLDGTQYHQSIPGPGLPCAGQHRPRGSPSRATPSCCRRPDQLARQHASWRVFVIPGLLLVSWSVVRVGLVVLRSRRRRHRRLPDGTAAAEPR